MINLARGDVEAAAPAAHGALAAAAAAADPYGRHRFRVTPGGAREAGDPRWIPELPPHFLIWERKALGSDEEADEEEEEEDEDDDDDDDDDWWGLVKEGRGENRIRARA